MKSCDVFSPRGKGRLSKVAVYCRAIAVAMIMNWNLFVVEGIRKYELMRLKCLFKETSLPELYRISKWFYQL